MVSLLKGTRPSSSSDESSSLKVRLCEFGGGMEAVEMDDWLLDGRENTSPSSVETSGVVVED